MENKLSLPESYKITYSGGSGEITEKKSRFIATVCPIATEDEALAFIEATKRNTGMHATTATPLSSA